MFHHSCFSSIPLLSENGFPGFRVVLAGEDVSDHEREHHRAHATLAVRALSNSRLSQLRAAILLGLTREILDSRQSLLWGGHSSKWPARYRSGG